MCYKRIECFKMYACMLTFRCVIQEKDFNISCDSYKDFFLYRYETADDVEV